MGGEPSIMGRGCRLGERTGPFRREGAVYDGKGRQCERMGSFRREGAVYDGEGLSMRKDGAI